MDRRIARLGLFLVVALIGVGRSASAQVPQPNIPDTTQRSGLFTHFTPVPNRLPPDHKRDTFYGTRWADSPDIPFPNYVGTSGLYGQRYCADCTACYYPSFRGSPGANTLKPDCARGPKITRFVTNFTKPFKPVGHYYANGCYAPVYDLDPLVTGPGPFPWPFFMKRPVGG